MIRLSKNIYIWLIICSMATFFTFASNGAMNTILIGLMGIIPLALIVQYPYLRKKEYSLYILFFLMLFGAVNHPETFRLSTIIYSALFILTYVYYSRLIEEIHLDVALYSRVIRFLIWAYFLVILLQQIGWLMNWPIFNYRVGDLSVMKFNSLASEPSYAAKILTVLMLSYIKIREIEVGRSYNLFKDFLKDKYIWIIFLYQMITCGSSFAYVLLPVLFVRFFKLKQIILFLLISIIPIVILSKTSFVQVDRVINLGKAILTLDESAMFEADGSGAFRVAPSIRYAKELQLDDFDTWFGYGVDYTKFHLVYLSDAVIEDEGLDIGLFPGFIWDFGIISMFLLVYFVCRRVVSDKLELLLWFVICLDAPFNTQLFWITVILMSTNKYLINRESSCVGQKSYE